MKSTKGLTYKRTEKAILNAFMVLASKKPFENITVQNILDEALISRYTFYHHFHDKYEVAETIQANLFENFEFFFKNEFPSLETSSMSSDKFNETAQIVLLKLFNENQLAFQALKNIHTENVNIFNKIKVFFKTQYLNNANSSHTNNELLTLESSIYGGLITSVLEYTKDFPVSGLGNNLPAHLNDAYINVFLYAMGIQEKDSIKKCTAFLRSQYNDKFSKT
ncbi:MAG: TetR/AcrR family transcriptional regulator [Suipraeoptans sp.]